MSVVRPLRVPASGESLLTSTFRSRVSSVVRPPRVPALVYGESLLTGTLSTIVSSSRAARVVGESLRTGTLNMQPLIRLE